MLARLIQIRTLLAALIALLALRMPAHAAGEGDEQESDTEEGQGAEETETGVDPNQPSVYSGGRYTIVTFPEAELFRTLMLVEGVLELRADLGIEMSKGKTFDVWTIDLHGRYGVSDTLEVQAGLDAQSVVPDGADNSIGAFAAVEGSIMYDTIDWRVGVAKPFESGDFHLAIFAGLPLKIRLLKDRLAIIALEKILTINTYSVPKPTATDPDATALKKPDLTISLGFLVQVLKPLAVIARAELTSVGFEGDPLVAVEVDGQYTISNRMDVGVALKLKNLNKQETQTGSTDLKRLPIDEREVAFFFRFRI